MKVPLFIFLSPQGFFHQGGSGEGPCLGCAAILNRKSEWSVRSVCYRMFFSRVDTARSLSPRVGTTSSYPEHLAPRGGSRSAWPWPQQCRRWGWPSGRWCPTCFDRVDNEMAMTKLRYPALCKPHLNSWEKSSESFPNLIMRWKPWK